MSSIFKISLITLFSTALFASVSFAEETTSEMASEVVEIAEDAVENATDEAVEEAEEAVEGIVEEATDAIESVQ